MSAPLFPVQTDPADQTRDMARRHGSLKHEQDKREPAVNTIEHGGKIFVADVEKVAATTLRDVSGKPVFRRVYTDDASGMSLADQPTLLRNYGKSSKASAVFSGNHGMGLILANGMNNSEGLAVISRTEGEEYPHMSVWVVRPNDDGEMVGQLHPFWIDEEPVAVIELFEEQGPTFGGIDWYKVWKSAYDNPKFKAEYGNDGIPPSGTVVVECGDTPMESTYTKTQRVFDPAKNEWVYSRWAMGGYYNQKFWEIPIAMYWAVPGTEFGWDFAKDEPRKDGKIKFDKSSDWEYRTVTGLREQIYLTTDDDASKARSTVEVDSHDNYGGVMPFDVEVYIRRLPEGVEARKLNFQVRRAGRIFVDFNGEVFEHPDPVTAHAQFGMTNRTARENVWVRILPKHFGAVNGGVWMGDGRKGLSVFQASGDHIEMPWAAIAREFKNAVPAKLVEFIKELDAEATDAGLDDKDFQKFWEKTSSEFHKPKKPGTGKLKPDPDGTEKMERHTGRRGPIVNPGVTHPPGAGTTTRRPPKKEIPASTEKTPEKKTPQPPKVEWVETLEAWPTKNAWAVMWDEPSDMNDHRGKVWFNWNHWYIQEKYVELTGDGGMFSHAPNVVMEKMRATFTKSVATKIGHRYHSERKNAKTLGITPDELDAMFSPATLSGYVMGVWDHERHLMDALRSAGRIEAA